MLSRRRGYLAVTCGAALWGVSGTAAKYLFSTSAVPPLLLVQVRMALSFAFLFLGLAIMAPRLLHLPRALWGYVVVWGVLGLGAVQFTYFLAIAETNVATAVFLQYVSPILTALYGWVRGKEHLSRPLLLALALAMAGSFLLIFGGGARLLVSPLGLLAGLGSALFMAFYTIYGQRGLAAVSPWTLLVYGLGSGALFWMLTDVVLALLGRAPDLSPLAGGWALWGFFGYIALLATVIPFGLYLTGLRALSPTSATLTGMIEPVVGGVSAFFLLDERLLLIQVLGGLLIVGAVIHLQVRSSAPNLNPAS